jgi:hypothetical protein
MWLTRCMLLLERGLYIHYGQDAALYFAAQFGHLETVAFLLDRGANAWSERAMLQPSSAPIREPVFLDRRNSPSPPLSRRRYILALLAACFVASMNLIKLVLLGMLATAAKVEAAEGGVNGRKLVRACA